MYCDYCDCPPELCECHGAPKDFPDQHPEWSGELHTRMLTEVVVYKGKRSVWGQGVWWVTAKGTKVRITSMKDSHLRNGFNHIVNTKPERKDSVLFRAVESEMKRRGVSNIQKTNF